MKQRPRIHYTESQKAVKAYRELTKGLSVVAIIGLVFSCSATLLAGARDLQYLAGQTRRLRIGLLIAAALLVAGAMEVSLLLHWPPARLLPRDAAAIIVLADTVSIGNGTVLSLLLVATYGVASLVVFDRVRVRAAEIEPDRTKREQWLADKRSGITANSTAPARSSPSRAPHCWWPVDITL